MGNSEKKDEYNLALDKMEFNLISIKNEILVTYGFMHYKVSMLLNAIECLCNNLHQYRRAENITPEKMESIKERFGKIQVEYFDNIHVIQSELILINKEISRVDVINEVSHEILQVNRLVSEINKLFSMNNNSLGDVFSAGTEKLNELSEKLNQIYGSKLILHTLQFHTDLNVVEKIIDKEPIGKELIDSHSKHEISYLNRLIEEINNL